MPRCRKQLQASPSKSSFLLSCRKSHAASSKLIGLECLGKYLYVNSLSIITCLLLSNRWCLFQIYISIIVEDSVKELSCFKCKSVFWLGCWSPKTYSMSWFQVRYLRLLINHWILITILVSAFLFCIVLSFSLLLSS